MPNRILGHLDQHRVTGFQGEFNALGLSVKTGSVPIDFARVQHGVASPTDINERSFHAGQHVLNTTQIDIADHGRGCTLGHVVLNQHPIFENSDLDPIITLTYHHDALERLTSSEEFGLTQDWCTSASSLTTFAAALLLGLQARRTAHPVGIGASGILGFTRFTDLNNGVRRIIR